MGEKEMTTEEELEQKAGEYLLQNTEERQYGDGYFLEPLKNIKQAFKDGYEQGQLSSNSLQLKKENETLKWEQKQILEDNDNYQKENEELKVKLKDLENGNVAWQGDMDSTIKQNLELKVQIEKMNKIMTDVFEDMEADMCSTENEILFDYLKRFLKKYEVIV